MMSRHQLGTSVYFVDLGWNFRLDLKGISGSGASCLTFESNERSQFESFETLKRFKIFCVLFSFIVTCIHERSTFGDQK